MRYLLDTNVVSEFANKEPEQAVIKWFRKHRRDDLYISVITVGEIQQGISRLPISKRRTQLSSWLYETVLGTYADVLLAVEMATMVQWGELTAQLLQQGNKMPVMDAMIAATALEHNLTLVTRNASDFANVGVTLVNPWEKDAL